MTSGGTVSGTDAKIHVIGVGNDGLAGLTPHARELLLRADLVLGADDALALLPDLPGKKQPLGPDLAAAARLLEANRNQRVAVVATGDPLFYGVAGYLSDRLGKDAFEVLPHVSSMQLAFARVKESWEDAYLTNLATHPLDDVVLDRIRTADTVGLFTSPQATPAAVARALLANGIDYFRAHVCENLGTPSEWVTTGELDEIAGMEFGPLNVLILRRHRDRPDRPRRPGQYRRFGNPAEAFAQGGPRRALITRAEVRAVSLAWLDLQADSVVWDVGAGSGSVAIEAARLAERGNVHAIEQDVTDYQLLRANLDLFGAANVRPVQGTAPEVFAGLPAPDAIFVGGTGKEVARLLEAAYRALKPAGRLVVHVAALEALTTAYGTLKGLAGDVEALLVQMARGVPQLDSLRFEAANPSFLLRVVKAAAC
jgi:precorrin-6Y C5,15-methyltransferase (decarboxylating)